MPMATPTGKSSVAPKPAGPPASANSASRRLEKGNPGVRRSTPDSEALASSDDEVEQPQNQQTPSTSTPPVPKPARRTSWLNELPQNLQRKASLSSGATLTSTGSNPSTPATDQAGWGSTTSPGLNSSISWGHTGSNFPWGTGIWNTESRKEPPSRLTELSQSPTRPNAVNTAGHAPDEILSPTARSMVGDASIPFTIPLHPTPKTYRSQSYSVGQLDPETVQLMATKAANQYNATRGRTGNQYAGLQHRSSRPSMLGDLGHDSAQLGRVREDDDDEEDDGNDSDNGPPYGSNQARTIEQLTLENALLRQAASQLDGNRLRDRASSTASGTSGYSLHGGVHHLHRIHGSVPEEADLAVEDLDELGDIPPGYGNIRNSGRRRFSEHSANLEKQFPPYASVENRPLENLKRAHWQTSLGFGSISELPQSRRHSFADISTRQGSISSIGEAVPPGGGINPRSGLIDREEGYANIIDGALTSPSGENPSYFAGREHLRPGTDALTSLHQAYNVPASYGRQQPGLSQPHQNQLLYIVTFKCHRADVFYIQEDTGLQVKPGDLVIVEADRGTDLGTIQHANVSWQKARELKEQYAEEHYKWLMMFSRQGQNGASNVVSPGLNSRSAVGGMGPTGAHGAHEPQSTEIKPKLIKRLAQNHEILTLRDKEGNEAKAKRVCQQKVVEHRLNMEILDAEFQMDWKKLTFYYFADSYINFNSLVTDLFKIYKTRIWMSAINPASFVTPSAGLPAPGANTPSFGPESTPDRRHQPDNRGYNGSGSPRDPLDHRDTATTLRSAYMDPYQAFGAAGRQQEMGFGHGIPPTDPFSSYPSNGYGLMDTAGAEFAGSATASNGQRINPTQGEWVNRFQGLSLGS